jgi:hypothetical protein
MEVAGSWDDALGAGVAAWMPARMAPLAYTLSRVLAAGVLDVIAMCDGERKLIRLVAPRSRLRPADLVGIAERDT